MRTVNDLDKNQRQRMFRYVSRNADVSSSALADDLNLDPRTVIAWKAWVTRTLEKRFNEALQ